MNENTKGNLGDPLTASDADNDLLRYSISGTDADCFSIDKTSGQLSLNAERDYETTLAKCKDDGDARTEVSSGAGNPENNVYTVTVAATDPSGAIGTETVKVTVKDANEAAEFSTGAKADSNKTLYIEENKKSSGTGEAKLRLRTVETYTYDNNSPEAHAPAVYTATDLDADDTGTITYAVEGADRKHFSISTGAALSIIETGADLLGTDGANYEKKSSYSITIVAGSGGTSTTAPIDHGERALYARLNVTIKVVNREDRGTVKLSMQEPQVGKPVVATLSDEDGGVTEVTWKWYRGVKDTSTDTGLQAGVP